MATRKRNIESHKFASKVEEVRFWLEVNRDRLATAETALIDAKRAVQMAQYHCKHFEEKVRYYEANPQDQGQEAIPGIDF